MTKFNPIVLTVLFCHFLSSFTILGMPLFFPKIMENFLTSEQQMYIGWFYVLPTICTAISSPLWGRFADKYGKRLSLMRAQLGLMIGFIIAGIAPNLWVFSLGLIIQGTCGGTFAASNAYLASQVRPNELAKTLNVTQFSARLSMMVAPILLGVFISIDKPVTLYCYLAVLPCCAAIAISRLPVKEKQYDKALKKTNRAHKGQGFLLSFNRILLIKFLFSFSVVVSFPYFYPYMQGLGATNNTLIGWYFSLPHLVYLVVIAVNSNWQKQCSATHMCTLGLGALLASVLCQYQAVNDNYIFMWRLLMGVGICLTFIGLHQGIAVLKTEKTGLMFGRFDSVSKWAGVIAGLCSGLAIQNFNVHSPFLISALTSTAALMLLILPQVKQPETKQYVS
ncbi:MFS transporter [Thalassotalea ganghwensis]